MTEPGPFAPPSGAITPQPSASPPPLTTPLLPPPTGSPIGTTLPAAPPPPRRRRWLAPVIAGGAALFVALAVGLGFAAAQLGSSVARAPFAAPPEEEYDELDTLLRGDPGSPVAEEPLTCGACFNLAHAQLISFPSSTYSALGVPITDGFQYESTVGADQIQNSSWWSSDGGGPDECYFAYTHAPLYLLPNDSAGASANDDDVYYPDWHSDRDEIYALTESIRVFDDTALATTHLAEIETAVAGCPTVSFPDQGWSASLTATAALDLPPSVAAYGWAEGNDFGRYLMVDLQRGNLVVRLSLWTDAYGATESEFRAFAEEYATKLAELEPQS